MKIKTTRRFKLFGEERFKLIDSKPKAEPIVDLETALEKRDHLVMEFSGGGIKGVMSAYIARCLEAHYQGLIHRKLKKLWGCSTGAIIAAMYNLGIYREKGGKENPWPFAEILRWYIEEGPLVFQERMLGGGFGSIYNPKKLEKILKGQFQEITFGHMRSVTGIELNIRVVNASENVPQVMNWKTAPDYPIWAMIRASMSAPVFFPRFEYAGDVYADGGCGMYNCNAVPAYRDAVLNEGWQTRDFYLLSIGTGRKSVGKFGKNKISQIKWFMNYSREESTNEQELKLKKYQQRHKLRYHRWNIDLPDKLTSMDDTDNIDELIKLIDR
jgi:hypothetical protein